MDNGSVKKASKNKKYMALVTKNIGSDAKGKPQIVLKKGQQVELTKEKAEAYRKLKFIK